MATVTIPITATRREIRCVQLSCYNSLDELESNPLRKYSMTIKRVSEPQDANGTTVGSREPLPELSVNLATLMGE